MTNYENYGNFTCARCQRPPIGLYSNQGRCQLTVISIKYCNANCFSILNPNYSPYITQWKRHDITCCHRCGSIAFCNGRDRVNVQQPISKKLTHLETQPSYIHKQFRESSGITFERSTYWWSLMMHLSSRCTQRLYITPKIHIELFWHIETSKAIGFLI